MNKTKVKIFGIILIIIILPTDAGANCWIAVNVLAAVAPPWRSG